jgi:hypothetical protein
VVVAEASGPSPQFTFVLYAILTSSIVYSRNMTLDADGTAVGEPRQYVPRHSPLTPQVSYLTSPSRSRRAIEEEENDNEEDEDEDEEDEDDSDDDEDEEDEDRPSSVPGQPELSRAERRELKKKQAAEQAAKLAPGGEDDDLLVNPNRVTKKLNISDLSAPRELTRRERCVPLPSRSLQYSSSFFLT